MIRFLSPFLSPSLICLTTLPIIITTLILTLILFLHHVINFKWILISILLQYLVWESVEFGELVFDIVLLLLGLIVLPSKYQWIYFWHISHWFPIFDLLLRSFWPLDILIPLLYTLGLTAVDIWGYFSPVQVLFLFDLVGFLKVLFGLEQDHS